MILSLRTDTPVAYISLLNADGSVIRQEAWEADRSMADGLHRHILSLLQTAGADWGDLEGVAVFRGPGSFTGLRIGITVANALAYGLNMPVAGEISETWQEQALTRLQHGENDRIVLPHYGSDPNITRPKK